MSRGSLQNTITQIFILLVGLFLMFLVYEDVYKRTSILINGEQTTGIVKDKDEYDCWGSTCEKYEVSFKTSNGSDAIGVDTVDSSVRYDRYAIGGKVEISYDQKNPTTLLIKGNNRGLLGVTLIAPLGLVIIISALLNLTHPSFDTPKPSKK